MKSATPPASVLVPFGTLVSLLGGAPATAALAGETDAEPFAAALDGPRAWLTPGAGTDEPSPGTARQFALEVASAKLRAFAAICRVLATSGSPTELAEGQIRGRLFAHTGTLMPARWCIEVHVDAAPPADDRGTELRRGLGSLLAQLLFANDQRTPADAMLVATQLATEFTHGARAAGGQPEDYARSLLTRHDCADWSTAVHAAHMRLPARRSPPDVVWLLTGELLLRLASDVPGFSFESDPLPELHTCLATVGQRLDVATFGAQARQDELRALLQANLARHRREGQG